MDSRSAATRVALIETAERLFAEQGIEAVSLRDVSRAAGQRNHSAAQYHFGDRAGLVAAVYEHRMRDVNERRQAMLATVAADDVRVARRRRSSSPLAGVVAETDGWYGRFLARTQWDPFASEVVERPAGASRLPPGRRPARRGAAAPARGRPSRPPRPDGRPAHRHHRRLGVAPPPRPSGCCRSTLLEADLTATVTAVLTAPSTITHGDPP